MYICSVHMCTCMFSLQAAPIIRGMFSLDRAVLCYFISLARYICDRCVCIMSTEIAASGDLLFLSSFFFEN